MGKQRSHQADEQTEQLLKELKAGFQLSTDSAAIRRALVLARVIIGYADDDHKVTILDKNNQPVQILLNG